MEIIYLIIIIFLIVALSFSFYYIFNLKKTFKSMLETEDKYYHTNNQELTEKLNDQNILIEEMDDKIKDIKTEKLNLIWSFENFITDFYFLSIKPEKNTNPNLKDFLNANNMEIIKNIGTLIPIVSAFKNNKIAKEKFLKIIEELNLDGIFNEHIMEDELIQFSKFLITTNDIIFSISELQSYIERKKEDNE